MVSLWTPNLNYSKKSLIYFALQFQFVLPARVSFVSKDNQTFHFDLSKSLQNVLEQGG